MVESAIVRRSLRVILCGMEWYENGRMAQQMDGGFHRYCFGAPSSGR